MCLCAEVVKAALPQLRRYSNAADLTARHAGSKEGGDGGSVDGGEVRDHKEMAKRYAKASKRQRGLMLDELCALTGYNRSYAARHLRERARGEPPRRARRRGQAPTYDHELNQALEQGLGDAGRHLRQAPGSGHGAYGRGPGAPG